MTHRPHRGNNGPPGSLLNENPGSDLSDNQQTGRRSQLDDRYKAASTQFNAARVRVMEASAAQLKSLLQVSPAVRMEHLDDPILTEADRQHLKASIVVPSSPKKPTGRAKFRWGLWQPTLAQTMIGAFLVMPALVGLGLAWRNTPKSKEALEDVELEWHLPDGRTVRTMLQAGHQFSYLPQHDGTVLIRAWIPEGGYATAQAKVAE